MERKTKIVKVLVIAFCFLSVSTFTPTIQARVENAAFKNFIGRSIEHGVDSRSNPHLNLTTLKHLHQIMKALFKIDNYTLYKFLYLLSTATPYAMVFYTFITAITTIIYYRIFRLLGFDPLESYFASSGISGATISIIPLYLLMILSACSVSLVFYVTDEKGVPIDNATICAIPSRGPLPGIEDPYIAEKNDEPGVYTIHLLIQPPGVYNYTVTAPRYQNFTGQTDDIPPGGIEYVHVILKRAE